MTRVMLCLLFLLNLGECWSQNNSNWGRGPIEMSEEQPLYRLHLSLPAISPEILSPNSIALRLGYAWSNTASRKEGAYQIDAEERSTDIQFKYGLNSNLEIGLDLPIIWRGAGILDSAIDNWHNFWNLPEGDRPSIERDQFNVSGVNSDGTDYGLNSKGIGLGNLKLSTKYLITSGNKNIPATAAFFTVSFPTARESFGHNGLDFGAMLLLSKKLGAIYLYTGGAYVYLTDPEVAGLTFRQNQFEGFIQAEYQFWERYSFNLGVSSSSKRLKSAKDFPSSALYIDTGIKYAISPESNLEILVRENPYPRETTTDFTFLLGYDSHWSL